MPSLMLYLAPVVLLFPLGASGDLTADWHGEAGGSELPEIEATSGTADKLRTATGANSILPLTSRYQVRIERRVTVRIAPRRISPRQNLTADLQESSPPVRLEEGDNTDCVEISSVAGVQTGSGNRLIFYLRDQTMLSARLEKSCRARDFYSGFYVERGEDGKICVNRDKLQSRSGAKCELERMRELTPIYN